MDNPTEKELDDMEFKRLNRERAAEKYYQAPTETNEDDEDNTRSDPHI